MKKDEASIERKVLAWRKFAPDTIGRWLGQVA